VHALPDMSSGSENNPFQDRFPYAQSLYIILIKKESERLLKNY